ncbi:MAG: peroxiredoxin [Gammaproteobacteria bacterium]|nr:peroxiredoxin [Gammaproteobacteria bacterium]MDH4254013.1 peroxiredoxin [Gammaproteobacteria bacterium]MDH5311127.1 peroxiredoxin [Gammaproteobacteria bacterium]
MLQPGTRAPEFTLPDETGAPRSLRELLADGPLILYFYPADFTPGCTREACSIRDIHADILAAGLRVVGVSPQDGDSHRKFRDEYGLPFSLLSDEDKVVVRAYDVDGPFGVGVRRVTYLIGRDGEIRDALQADILVGRHTSFIENAMRLRSA